MEDAVPGSVLVGAYGTDEVDLMTTKLETGRPLYKANSSDER